jgi:Tfp pilus assembly protein PilF
VLEDDWFDERNEGGLPMKLFTLLSITTAATILSFSGVNAQSFSLGRAQSMAAARDWKGLLAYSQAGTQAEPNNADAWYGMALAYGSKEYKLGLQEPANAAPAYQRAVSLRANWPEAWYALGMTHQELGQYDASIGDFQRAIQQAPGRMNYHISLAGTYSHQRKVGLAKQELAIVEANAKTANDWFVVGNNLNDLGGFFIDGESFQRAEAAYQHALQLAPQYGQIWTNYGVAQEALGKYQAALNDYQKGSQMGDSQAGKNYAKLQGDIQACHLQASQILQRGWVTSLEFTSYKQHCDKFR